MRDHILQTQQKNILLAESDGCAVWHLQDKTGEGTVTCYSVFPGVTLCFQDFHMEQCTLSCSKISNLLILDHCREGRLSYSAGENAYACIGPGEIRLKQSRAYFEQYTFPSAHYHGLSLLFDADHAALSLSKAMDGFAVTPQKIMHKFALREQPKTLHVPEQAAHIFSELYQIPENARISYFRLKILELLLCLDGMVIPQEASETVFYKTQLEKTQAIRNFLAEHLSENYTQEELSARFNFALTPMKNCFKSTYGTSIGAWLTDYRMNYAAELLQKEKRRNIAEVAAQVGYDSASKFAAAFKKVKKMTPAEYRNTVR